LENSFVSGEEYSLGFRVEISYDGSPTLFHPFYKEYYRSLYGAIQESRRIFVEGGLRMALSRYKDLYLVQDSNFTPFRILEVGFGIGVNFLLTLRELNEKDISWEYTGIEKEWVPESVWKLFYKTGLKRGVFSLEEIQIANSIIERVYEDPTKTSINFPFSRGVLTFLYGDLNHFSPPSPPHHLIYFDPFSPKKNPEVWSEHAGGFLRETLFPGGVIVTYSCSRKGRELFKKVGCRVEKCPGPPGKKNFLRGFKEEGI